MYLNWTAKKKVRERRKGYKVKKKIGLSDVFVFMKFLFNINCALNGSLKYQDRNKRT